MPQDRAEAEGQGTFNPAVSAGLFVGISSFEDERIHEVPFAVDDAVDLAHLFVLELGLVLPEHTVLLLSGLPRKPGSIDRMARLDECGARLRSARMPDVYRYLGELTRGTEERGLFILTMATHGVSDQGGDFLLASDSLIERPVRTGVAVAEMFDQVKRAGASRRLVLLDACRERLSDGTRGLVGTVMTQSFASAIAHAKGSVVLSGATLGGFAYDDGVRMNGVFTAAVLDGLSGEAQANPEGWITVRTLADFVQQRVSAWVRRNRPDHAATSLGIERRIEATAEAMPLAPHAVATQELQRYRARREAALARVKENQGRILSGACWDQIVALLPEKAPAPEAEWLFEEIEALDGTERAQRSLRDFLRELLGRASQLPRVEEKRAEDHSSPKIQARVNKESELNLVPLKPLPLADEPRKEVAAPNFSPIDRPLRPESLSTKPIEKTIEKAGRSDHSGKSMSRILDRHSETIYASLRFVAGFLFMFHGVQKIFGAFGVVTPPVGSLAWFGGIIELFAGNLIMIGLFASWAAFLASGEMAMAYFIAHQPQGTWPIENKGGPAVLYAFIFLCIAARGAGPFSVAARRARESRILGRYADLIDALLRFVAGFTFMFYGLQKIFGLVGGQKVPVGSLIWFGGIIELFGGTLIMMGLLASWAAFLASGQMAVAYFMAHQPQGIWPVQNHGELAVLYCFVFLYIAARGSGPFSVARALGKPALD